MRGRVQIEPYLHFRSAGKTKKYSFAKGSFKFREVINCFLEGNRREETHLKKVTERKLTYYRHVFVHSACNLLMLRAMFTVQGSN